MNSHIWPGGAELLAGVALLFSSSFVATNLLAWLLRPAVMHALTRFLGLGVLVGSAWYLMAVLQAGYLRRRVLFWGVIGLTVLFSPRTALEEEALRFAERASRWHIDRRHVVGLTLVGAFLLLIGFVTLRNGLNGLSSW